jgi:hypothetical protein
MLAGLSARQYSITLEGPGGSHDQETERPMDLGSVAILSSSSASVIDALHVPRLGTFHTFS